MANPAQKGRHSITPRLVVRDPKKLRAVILCACHMGRCKGAVLIYTKFLRPIRPWAC